MKKWFSSFTEKQNISFEIPYKRYFALNILSLLLILFLTYFVFLYLKQSHPQQCYIVSIRENKDYAFIKQIADQFKEHFSTRIIPAWDETFNEFQYAVLIGDMYQNEKEAIRKKDTFREKKKEIAPNTAAVAIVKQIYYYRLDQIKTHDVFLSHPHFLLLKKKQKDNN